MMAPENYLERFPATMDRDRRLHAAMVAPLDDAIGSVLSKLTARGLDNTVVFFMSDNGATQEERADHRGRIYRGGSNRPYRGAKGSLFEGGIRVPAMLSWPGAIAPAQVRNECGVAMDILPTFLKWAGGLPCPSRWHDLARRWKESPSGPSAIYSGPTTASSPPAEAPGNSSRTTANAWETTSASKPGCRT